MGVICSSLDIVCLIIDLQATVSVFTDVSMDANCK